jgi:methionine biosynthesis protein MetW
MPVRVDYQMIEEYIDPGSRVLDLGCGDGTLLDQLIEGKGCDVIGVDSDLDAVHQCIARGVPVYHGDMLEAMSMFADGRFHCVVLSQTLQQTDQPERVVSEMLRVGKRAIISFPNFAQWRVRLQILLRGRMPRTCSLPQSWYDTPNIHLLSIKDFVAFCLARHLRIVDTIYLGPTYRRLSRALANIRADMAIFVVEQEAAAP